MRHRYVIALLVILCYLLNNSNGLSSEDDLLANKCPPSVFVPTHGSTRTVTWTPPYAQSRTGILKHIKVHPKEAKPPFKAPKGETHIKYTLTLANGEETSCSFKITIFKGITIAKGPHSKYEVMEGSSITLQCYGQNPDKEKISYKWLFNNSPLKYDNHRFWDANYYLLSLKYVKSNHSGKYTCVAYTTGEKRSEASVSTYVKIHAGKLEIVKRPEKDHISIIEGDSLRLPCKANYPNNEVKYDWYLNHSPLIFDNHSEWRASDNELVLKSLQVKHSGIYTCVVGNDWSISSLDTKITISAETFSFTAWGGWSKCLSTSGSNIGQRYRFRTCVTSSEKEAPGKCSGKTKQAENCDVEVSTPSPPVQTPTPTATASVIPVTILIKSTEKAIIRTPVRTPTPTETASVRPVTLPAKGKEGAIIAVRKVVAPSNSKNNSKFFDTFYGKLALGSSLAILVMILSCAVFVLVGRRIEKKDKKERRGYRPIKDLEDTPFNDGPSNEEYSDDYEDEMDRKAFEKRRVIKELTPKERKRSELDDDLIVARTIILEEGINKDHEKEVAEKRKKVVKSTSSAGCKKSLLESINSSRAIILDKDTTNVDKVERASVSFSPRKEHKPRISSGGSSRGSSYHSLDETKNTQNGNDEDSFSMMMVQPVQPLNFEARQATIKHTQDFDLKH